MLHDRNFIPCTGKILHFTMSEKMGVGAYLALYTGSTGSSFTK
jgi:hypothetical protein